MEITAVPEPLASVMIACEVNCIAGCCGLDAFDIRPEWIRQWLDSNDRQALDLAHQQIKELIEYVSVEEWQVDFPILNEYGSSSSFVQILENWKVAIEQAPNSPLPIIPAPESQSEKRRREAAEALAGIGCIAVVAAPVVMLIGLIYWLLGRL